MHERKWHVHKVSKVCVPIHIFAPYALSVYMIENLIKMSLHSAMRRFCCFLPTRCWVSYRSFCDLQAVNKISRAVHRMLSDLQGPSSCYGQSKAFKHRTCQLPGPVLKSLCAYAVDFIAAERKRGGGG